MQAALHCPHRHAEALRHFTLGKLLEKSEQDRVAEMPRQIHDQRPDGVSALRLSQLRSAGSLVLLALGLALTRPQLMRVRRRDLRQLAFLGICGLALVHATYYAAMATSTCAAMCSSAMSCNSANVAMCWNFSRSALLFGKPFE